MPRMLSGFVGLVLSVSLTSCSMHTPSTTPVTAWGHPDLRGVWDYRTITPLERPEQLGDRARFQAAESTAFTRTSEERYREAFEPFLIVGDEPWADRGQELSEADRAALLTHPETGRLPPRTPYGEANFNAFVAQFLDAPDGPEDRPVQERCIIYPRIPLQSGNYNNNLQIVQTPTHVVLLMEMIHDARIVPLSDAPLLPLKTWLGQSRGHWEGDTLVVETTAFRDYRTPLGTSPDMRITERFTRRGDNSLSYGYTVDDPKAFTTSWSARQTLRRTGNRVYEYACHEANYSMVGTLRGTRMEESSLAERP